MACKCLSTVDAERAKDGQYIQVSLGSLLGGSDRPLLTLYRRDTDGKETRKKFPRYILPSFCPFCGIAYEPKVAGEVEGQGATVEGPGIEGPGIEAPAGGGPATAPAGGDAGPAGTPPSDAGDRPGDGAVDP